MTVDLTFDLLTLSLLPGVGPRTARDLSSRGTLATILAHWRDHGDLLPNEAGEALRTGAARRRAEQEVGRARALGVLLVGRDEPAYPALLRQAYDPPPVLWALGNLEENAGGDAVAIVGSRAALPEGRALARTLARDLAGVGVTVISGLARGIDTAAHLGALDANGRTVAVLGSGLDRLYPPENQRLAEEIAGRGGALVSEFPLGTSPYPGNFPRRNRVIAGWGRAVVVVEAAARSGALGTARAALEEGREVLAVPGHPSRNGSAGTNQLIRDGAVLVRDAADVALELGIALAVSTMSAAPEDDLLRQLPRGTPASLEEIQVRSGRPVGELLARLGQLEVAAKVRRLPGSLYVRA